MCVQFSLRKAFICELQYEPCLHEQQNTVHWIIYVNVTNQSGHGTSLLVSLSSCDVLSSDTLLNLQPVRTFSSSCCNSCRLIKTQMNLGGDVEPCCESEFLTWDFALTKIFHLGRCAFTTNKKGKERTDFAALSGDQLWFCGIFLWRILRCRCFPCTAWYAMVQCLCHGPMLMPWSNAYAMVQCLCHGPAADPFSQQSASHCLPALPI